MVAYAQEPYTYGENHKKHVTYMETYIYTFIYSESVNRFIPKYRYNIYVYAHKYLHIDKVLDWIFIFPLKIHGLKF